MIAINLYHTKEVSHNSLPSLFMQSIIARGFLLFGLSVIVGMKGVFLELSTFTVKNSWGFCTFLDASSTIDWLDRLEKLWFALLLAWWSKNNSNKKYAERVKYKTHTYALPAILIIYVCVLCFIHKGTMKDIQIPRLGVLGTLTDTADRTGGGRFIETRLNPSASSRSEF